MSGVCRKIKISPELKVIFDKNNEKKPDGSQKNYILFWFHGFFEGSRSTIEATIIKHYDDYFKKQWNKGNAPQDKLVKYRNAISEFVNDFRRLSFTDVDLLTQLKFKDITKFPITTINNQSIELEE